MSGRAGAVVAVLAAVLVLAATTRADGDPASDVLYTQWVFVPFDAPIPENESQRLKDIVDSARSVGYPIKVALIGAPADLGLVYSLWGKPQKYAEFLGKELVYLYKGPLLIVMPNGYGFFEAKGNAAPERGALAKLKVKPGPDGLVDSAVDAVARLAAAEGHSIAIPERKDRGGSSTNTDRLIIIAAAGGVLLLAVPALWLRARRRPH